MTAKTAKKGQAKAAMKGRKLKDGNQKITAAIVLPARMYFVLGRVAQLNGLHSAPLPDGERSWSASSVARQLLEGHMPKLEAKLRKAGLNLDEELSKAGLVE